MHVTERQAASMYARACRPRVVKNTIKQLRAVNDEAGVRMDIGRRRIAPRASGAAHWARPLPPL